MTNALQRRLEKVEATIEARETKGGVELQMGYVQLLPPDYVGERHLVTVSRLPNGYYEWEERPGPGPAGGGVSGTIIQVCFVGTKPYKLGDAGRKLEAARTQPGGMSAPEQQQPAAQHHDAPGREVSQGAPDSTGAARNVVDIIRNSGWVRPAPSGPKSRLVNTGSWQ